MWPENPGTQPYSCEGDQLHMTLKAGFRQGSLLSVHIGA